MKLRRIRSFHALNDPLKVNALGDDFTERLELPVPAGQPIAQAGVHSFVVVEADPLSDDAFGLLKPLKALLPQALLFEAAKEAFIMTP